MHVTGKILVWMVLPAAVAAFVFSARLVDARGKWMKQVQQLKIDNETAAAQLAEASGKREQARADLERENLRWTRFWSKVPGQFNPQHNLVADVGATSGLLANLTVYAFQLAQDGAPVAYVGPMSVTDAQPNLSTLKPTFRVRAADTARMNSGQLWRLRTLIPAAFASRIADLETELVVADELLAKQTSNLELQSKLVDAAREQRDDRVAELLGGSKAPAEGAGLVAEISAADEKRNASLAEVDRLRRAINAAVARVQQLIQENNDLARSLPQPRTSETALAAPPR